MLIEDFVIIFLEAKPKKLLTERQAGRLSTMTLTMKQVATRKLQTKIGADQPINKYGNNCCFGTSYNIVSKCIGPVN